MKKSILFLFFCIFISSLEAQKCLNLNIVAMMGKLESPGAAASSFKKCNTTKNDHNQTVIVDYGTDLKELDTTISRTTNDFNNAFMTGGLTNVNAQMPSQHDIEDSKQLAEKLKNMTPEQQKQWAMQVAQERQKGAGSSQIQDDAQTSKLVLQTQDIGVNQLKHLNDEFAAKLRDLNAAMSKELDEVKTGSYSGCPQDKTGLPACSCVNEIDGKYWQKKTAITDSYNNQKVGLLQSYLPKIKALVAAVDDNIVKLKYGDAVKSATLKRTLFSAQTSAFGNAFDITSACIKMVRKDGSNAYANKFNCDNVVYNLSCFK